MVGQRTRFVCIHGHFYQPPRENPWLEHIEIQESAHPYHDWNERIARECYIANTQARIVDPANRLIEVVNNYEHISFNFGPTLLSWLERFERHAYESILMADDSSRKARGGHGNAIAQGYNHMIMPLASARDKITQVVWGIEDFRSRFGRDPEGMWLPETAVDLETLRVMADHGIQFTLFAPSQARRYRDSAKSAWQLTSSTAIDPSQPYRCDLPGGGKITIFFFDGPISHGVAFEGLLNNGEYFAKRILEGFSAKRSWTQLVSVATDGESYGHHHRFGEMALTYAVRCLKKEPGVALTNFGEFLHRNPTTAEVELIENTSWSCSHGIGRWADDCGCALEKKAGANQKWRKPLRSALDLLRDRTDRIFEAHAGGLVANPWQARDRYISVLLDHHRNLGDFIRSNQSRPLSEDESVAVAELLEMQRNRMLMYTSCGWFFDDISGLESTQILRYAARVLQLAAPLDGSLDADFQAELSQAIGNADGNLRGDRLFRDNVLTRVVTLPQVAAHVAIMCLINQHDGPVDAYCYRYEFRDHTIEKPGQWSMLVARVVVANTITNARGEFVVAVLHLGGVDFRASVREFEDLEWFRNVRHDLFGSFSIQSSTDLIRKMDKYFPGAYYTLSDMFPEERSHALEDITDTMYAEQADAFATFHRKSKDLARFIKKSHAPLPDIFLTAARFVLNRMFKSELKKISRGRFPDGLERVIRETRFWGVLLDTGPAARLLDLHVLSLVEKLEGQPCDANIPQDIAKFLDLCKDLRIAVDLGQARATFFRIAKSVYSQGPASLPPQYNQLAEKLAVNLEMVVPE